MRRGDNVSRDNALPMRTFSAMNQGVMSAEEENGEKVGGPFDKNNIDVPKGQI